MFNALETDYILSLCYSTMYFDEEVK